MFIFKAKLNEDASNADGMQERRLMKEEVSM